MAQLRRSENHVVDNICNPIDPLAIGFCIRYRWRHQPDSSRVGLGCDRIDIQLGHWPTDRLEKRSVLHAVAMAAPNPLPFGNLMVLYGPERRFSPLVDLASIEEREARFEVALTRANFDAVRYAEVRVSILKGDRV